jgi:protocatechuate 3,4-dioxygenase, alpha subunit
MSPQATTSQTVGPFFALGLTWLCGEDFAAGDVPGERVVICGKVLDGESRAVPDALLEIWQANDQGRYTHPEDTQNKPLGAGFSGFGRLATDDDGNFRFGTIKPGRVPGPDGKLQAPHLVVSVFCRGLLRRLVTRIYFPGEASNVEDFALALVDKSRRQTLIAKPTDQSGALEWNVILQGAGETVFFDIGV